MLRYGAICGIAEAHFDLGKVYIYIDIWERPWTSARFDPGVAQVATNMGMPGIPTGVGQRLGKVELFFFLFILLPLILSFKKVSNILLLNTTNIVFLPPLSLINSRSYFFQFFTITAFNYPGKRPQTVCGKEQGSLFAHESHPRLVLQSTVQWHNTAWGGQNFENLFGRGHRLSRLLGPGRVLSQTAREMLFYTKA